MRLTPVNQVLLVLAAALLALDIVSRPEAPQVRVAVALLPALEQAQAEGTGAGAPMRLELSAPDLEQPLVLERATGTELERAPASLWRLPARQGWPAREGLVPNLLRGLGNLQTLDLLAQDAASHAGYGLDGEQAMRVRVLDGQGQVLADLLQGGLAPGGRAAYVRLFGSDEVWRAPGFSARLSAAPEVWMEPRWLPLQRSAVLVRALELSGSALDEPLRLERREGSLDLWLRPDGELASAASVRALLEGLEALFVGDVRSDPGGELAQAVRDEPLLRVRLERVDGSEPWVGHLGPAVAGERHLATRAPGDWTVSFPARSVAPLVELAGRL